jgi:hypothetical protein
MKKKKPSYTELHIANLKELKAGYEAKGDVFNASRTAELIAKWERKNVQN